MTLREVNLQFFNRPLSLADVTSNRLQHTDLSSHKNPDLHFFHSEAKLDFQQWAAWRRANSAVRRRGEGGGWWSIQQVSYGPARQVHIDHVRICWHVAIMSSQNTFHLLPVLPLVVLFPWYLSAQWLQFRPRSVERICYFACQCIQLEKILCCHKMGMFNEKDPGHKQKTSTVVFATDLTKTQRVAPVKQDRFLPINACCPQWI